MEQTQQRTQHSVSAEQQITERNIQCGLYAHLYWSGWRLFLPNVKFYDWESDFLTFNMEGQIHEFEIKTTRSDFLNDLKKPKHARLRNGRFSEYRIPNYFTFVLPAGLSKRYETPDYCGLMEWRVIDGAVRVTKVRSAKELTPIRACDADFKYLVEKSNEKMIKAWL